MMLTSHPANITTDKNLSNLSNLWLFFPSGLFDKR